MRTDHKKAAGWLWAAASGLLLAASFPPFGLGWLAWAALIPLWRAVLRARSLREAADLGGLAGLVFYGVSLHWLIKVFGPVAAAFWCVFALAVALHAAGLWLLRQAAGERGGLAGDFLFTVLAAALWTGIEYFRSEVWGLACPWLALGFSQSWHPAAMQSASLWGVYGISFLLAASNAAGVLFSRRRRMPGEVMIGVLAMILFLGERRARELPAEEGRELPVALIQDESYDMETLAAKTLSPEAASAALAVWPEYSFAVAPGQAERYRRLLARRLEGSRQVVVVGAAEFPEERGEPRNYSWVLGPGGEELGRYDKSRPIPYMERRLRPNPDPRPVDTPLGRLGMQICYDLDFEDGARTMVREGAELLVVTNLDPAEWGRWEHAQHSAMSAFRAVESGLWLVRAASSGESQIIDPAGRVRASLGALEEGVLTGSVRLKTGGTAYTRAGWLVGPLCLATALGLLILFVWERALAAYSRRRKGRLPVGGGAKRAVLSE